MHHADAVAMIETGALRGERPAVWAELGCGHGTFTLALAELLPPESTIHALDFDPSALRLIPAVHHKVTLTTHEVHFLGHPWPFTELDGILMANSLHYARDQASFLRTCRRHLKRQHQILVVDYDTRDANRWVPYPVDRTVLASLFAEVGDYSLAMLGTRPSTFRRSPLYAVLATARESWR